MTKARDLASQITSNVIANSGASWVADNHIEPFSKMDMSSLGASALTVFTNRSTNLFQASKTLTISNMSIFISTAGAIAGGSYARMLLYTYNGAANTATLVARTATDLTLLSATGLKTLALSNAGGYPTSITINAGTTYGFALSTDGTSAATILGISTASLPSLFLNSYITGGQSISGVPLSGLLPTGDSPTPANFTAATTNIPWFRLS